MKKYRIVEFNLGCKNNDLDYIYRVYVIIYFGFGANEVREYYEEFLLIFNVSLINLDMENIIFNILFNR